MIDDVKRDLRQNASELFIATLQRSMNAVVHRMVVAENFGTLTQFIYAEHRSTRGIPLLSLEVLS